jgi:hypothetical protein
MSTENEITENEITEIVSRYTRAGAAKEQATGHCP